MNNLNKTALLLAVSLTVLLAVGCSVDVDPSQKEMEWGVSVCESNGGLKILTVWDTFTPNAECSNGAKFSAKVSDLNNFIDDDS